MDLVGNADNESGPGMTALYPPDTAPLSVRVRAAALRLLPAYIILLTASLIAPALLPSIIAATLPGLSGLSPHYRIQSVQVGREIIDFKIENRDFTRLNGPGGRPGPTVSVDGSHQTSAVNVYPVTTFALVIGLAMSPRRLVRAMGIAAACVCVLMAIDCLVMAAWISTKATMQAAPQVLSAMPQTDANREAVLAIAAGQDRLTWLKSFISTGGRQFLSFISAGIALLASGAVRVGPLRT